MTQTLPKEERLSGKTAIATLMKKGHWGVSGCLRFCVLSPGGGEVNRVMVSVSKKNFKRAVRRNLLKRRMRESYRTQKDLLEGAGPLDLLRCLCPVEKMTQTIAGLSLDTDYILDYRCGGNFYSPIRFRYEKGLSQFFDLDFIYVDIFDVK